MTWEQFIDEWAGKDDRIQVIHQKNSGLSGARNAGLAVADGEYVVFVDSDDYVKNTMFIMYPIRWTRQEKGIV